MSAAATPDSVGASGPGGKSGGKIKKLDETVINRIAAGEVCACCRMKHPLT